MEDEWAGRGGGGVHQEADQDADQGLGRGGESMAVGGTACGGTKMEVAAGGHELSGQAVEGVRECGNGEDQGMESPVQGLGSHQGGGDHLGAGCHYVMVKKTVGMLAEEDARVGAWLAAMQKAEDLDSEETCARKATEEEVFLQTKTYALADVRKEVEKWRPSMVEERAALLNSGVIRAINQREAEALKKEALEKGIPYDRVPGKAVFTRKAATGRRKCRGVACGNFMSERPAADTYAGGIDASQVRAMVAAGAQRGWTLAGVDVKTAFLQVPPGRSKDIVVVNPPTIFQECQITEPGELWAVEGSVYGLTTSPKDWANHRDETMGAINWEMEDDEGTWACWFEKTKEVNLWRIKSSRHGQDETVGYMAVYIDDLLITGDRGAVAATLLKIRQVWDPSGVLHGGPNPRDPPRSLRSPLSHHGYRVGDVRPRPRRKPQQLSSDDLRLPQIFRTRGPFLLRNPHSSQRATLGNVMPV